MNIKFKFINNHGATLIEILVAGSIMLVVMVGAASIDSSVLKSHNRLSSGSFLTLKTSSTMVDITKNVSLMTGNAQFLGFNSVGNRFCVRQDYDVTTGNPNNTPANYTDDRWVCYQQVLEDIRKCIRPSPGVCLPNTYYVLGNAVANELQMTFLTNSTVGTQTFAVDVSIKNRITPNAAQGPNNPEIHLQSRILPLAHGFSSF